MASLTGTVSAVSFAPPLITVTAYGNGGIAPGFDVPEVGIIWPNGVNV